VARQTTGGRSAPEPELDDESPRSEQADELWAAVRIDPVEIALPKGVGYTLRAYRPVGEVTPTDVSEREEDAFPDRIRPAQDEESDELDDEDDEDAEDAELDDEDEEDDADSEDDEDLDEDEDDESADAELAEEDEDEEEADEDEEDDAAAAGGEPDEVPVFLGHAGRLFLFRSTEGLVEFVKSDAEHDLRQVDTWPDLVEKLTTDDVVPLPEDTYELDLVVSNLRGSHDAWDANLVIQAGEVARDVGYALRIDPIVAALSPGSPLDDLDEALRATEGGGFGSFFARRRLRKIGSEAAPLGWRTIIGKISSVVDWRD
jgi:hypothetical protein